jgi:uncharacterized membrane protein
MTNTFDSEVAARAAPLRAAQKVEDAARLDPLARAFDRIAGPLAQSPAAGALRGEWLGHALHPLMTDLPLGCWLGAGLLDVVGGRRARPAAQRLVGLGLLAVPLTAASGAVDSHDVTAPRPRRVVAVHAAGNTAVAALYALSWRARRAGHYQRGRVYGIAGGLLAWYTGYLGGHLSFGRGVGVGVRRAPGDPVAALGEHAGETPPEPTLMAEVVVGVATTEPPARPG